VASQEGLGKSLPWKAACYLFRVGFLFGLFFDPENGGDMFFRNVD
jgi:hypothetical protein